MFITMSMVPSPTSLLLLLLLLLLLFRCIKPPQLPPPPGLTIMAPLLLLHGET